MAYDLEDNELPSSVIDVDWWDASTDEELHNKLIAFYKRLFDQSTGRLELLRRHVRMYGNLPTSSSGTTLYDVGGGAMLDNERLKLNVVKSAVDTITSKITKNQPMPVPVVTGGNWSVNRKAKFLKKYFEYQFAESDMSEIATDVFQDVAITGTGCLKGYASGDDVVFERVYPGEVFVDEQDGLNRKPFMVLQRKAVDRKALAGKFPKKKGAIARAGDRIEDADDYSYDSASDSVTCIEVWRRGGEFGKGRHVIATDGDILLDEPWGETLPWEFVRWTRRPRGFWGIGLAEELTGIQVEVNRLLQKIQAAMHLVSVPRVFVEEGSRVLNAYLNNKIGMVVPYRGQKPIFEVPQSVHPEMFAHLNWLFNKAYEISGISQMSAGSGKPQRLSGIALNTYHDIESERFASVIIAWERMHLGVAKQMVRIAKEINKPVVVAKDKYTIQTVPWKQIDLDDDEFSLRIESASALPSTPAGRLQFVQSLLESGLITDPARGQRLLRIPDIDRDLDLETAQRDNIERVLENIIDEGLYEAPEPFIDMTLALKLASAEYNRAVQLEDIPEKHLNMLRRWMTQVNVLRKAALAEQQQIQSQPTAGAPPPVGTDGQSPMAQPQVM